MIKDYFHKLFRRYFAVSENHSKELGNPSRILIVRPHNQLGDMLASVSLFRAIKQKYPQANLTLIVSPANYIAITKNKYIDRIFIFDKRKLYYLHYFIQFWRLLREPYDLAIVPSTVSISFTSNLLARLSKSQSRIGLKELNGVINRYSYFFDRRIVMDWRKYPDCNVSDFCLDIVREFGISTNDFTSEISFDNNDDYKAKEFIKSLKHDENCLLIGLHVGAGKPPNRWSLNKFMELIQKLNNQYNVKFYLTGSHADKVELNYIKKNLDVQVGFFIDKSIPEVAALVSRSDLFITNDTGIMHVAGATKTSMISLFGPTNPYNWAPVGKNKYFLWKSDLIDDITVEDVLSLSQKILSEAQQVSVFREAGN